MPLIQYIVANSRTYLYVDSTNGNEGFIIIILPQMFWCWDPIPIHRWISNDLEDLRVWLIVHCHLWVGWAIIMILKSWLNRLNIRELPWLWPSYRNMTSLYAQYILITLTGQHNIIDSSFPLTPSIHDLLI